MTPRLLLRTPRTASRALVLDCCTQLPPPGSGYKLPNGTLIATHESDPGLIYKFTPWTQAGLAFHEVDAYARIQCAGGVTGLVRLQAVAATHAHFVRVLERAPEGALGQFLLRHGRSGGQSGASFARPLLAQLARTMAEFHALGLVHRDLKAENILVFAPEPGIAGAVRVKLSDLDRCSELPAGQFLRTPVGSLFHMAPELLDGQDHDRKVDVYAFGILMYEVVHAGAQPYPRVANCMPDSIPRTEFIARVIHDGLRPAWTDGDPALAALATRCWAADPRERPEFDEILACLDPQPRRAGAQRQAAADGIAGVGTASHIGKLRTSMEDAVCVLQSEEALVAGVFDGTHGADTSEFLARQMALTLAHGLASARPDADAALRKTFEQAEATLRAMDPAIESGSTAVVALVEQDALRLAWTGDSQACLFRRDRGDRGDRGDHGDHGDRGDRGFRASMLVQRHQPARPDEAARAIARGGSVGRDQQWLDNGEAAPFGPLRVFAPASPQRSGIALTRALGLFAFKPVLGAEPETATLARQEEDLFLVLATDGVFDYLGTDAMYARIAAAGSVQRAADAVIAAVLEAGAPDNASLVVIDLRRPPAGQVAAAWRQRTA